MRDDIKKRISITAVTSALVGLVPTILGGSFLAAVNSARRMPSTELYMASAILIPTCSLVALVAGLVAFALGAKSKGTTRGSGIAVLGLVLSVVGVVWIFILRGEEQIDSS